MIFRLNDNPWLFPDPKWAEPNGLLAIHGDLSVERLVAAYSCGIFPWYSEGEPILWYSPDPRMVLRPENFRYAKSLRRVVQSGRFEVRIDSCFEQVMRGCANMYREGQEGTWITEEMIEAYTRLHTHGLAHSFETFFDNQLVGGLYGVSLGRVFFGESMFHSMTDASKVAFVKLVEFCRSHGFDLIDAQQETPHLASLGATPMPREEFLDILSHQSFDSTLVGNWQAHAPRPVPPSKK